jgi:hypothetical protein
VRYFTLKKDVRQKRPKKGTKRVLKGQLSKVAATPRQQDKVIKQKSTHISASCAKI